MAWMHGRSGSARRHLSALKATDGSLLLVPASLARQYESHRDPLLESFDIVRGLQKVVAVAVTSANFQPDDVSRQQLHGNKSTPAGTDCHHRTMALDGNHRLASEFVQFTSGSLHERVDRRPQLEIWSCWRGC